MLNASRKTTGLEFLAEQLSNRHMATAVVEAALCVVLNIAALFSNAILCWTVYVNNRLRRVTNIYVLVLAVADLLTASLVMPFLCSVSIYGSWNFSWFVCQFQAYCSVVLAYTAQLMLPLTAINRYVRVLRPGIYTKLFVRKYILLSFAFVSICAICAPLPYLLEGHKFAFHPGMMICFYTIENAREKQTIYRIIFFTILPMVIVACCYLRICSAVKQHTKSLKNTEHPTASATPPRRRKDTPEANTAPSHKLSSDDILMTKALFAITFAFFVCWTPLYVITSIDTANGDFCLPRQAYFFATYLVGVSSIANPIIFGYIYATFRDEFRRLVKPLQLKKPRINVRDIS